MWYFRLFLIKTIAYKTKIRIFLKKRKYPLFRISQWSTSWKISEKSNEPFSGNLQKSAIFCMFLIKNKNKQIFRKNRKSSLFRISGYPTFWKVSEKSNEQILRKVRYGRTDERTDGTGFIGSSLINIEDPKMQP